jgi:hypothetical protein
MLDKDGGDLHLTSKKNGKIRNIVFLESDVPEWIAFDTPDCIYKYCIFKYFSELGNFRSSDLLYFYIFRYYCACYALWILSDWGSINSTGIIKNK